MSDALAKTTPAAPARLRGFGMNDRFGFFLRAFARRYLDDIAYPEDMAERVRKLSDEGIVVYVHRAQNPADHLALAAAAHRHALPLARFVGG